MRKYNIYYDYSNGDSCFQRSFGTMKEAINSYNRDYSGKITNSNDVCLRRYKGNKSL